MARSLVALFCLITLPRLLAGQADTARTDTTLMGVRPAFQVAPLALREPEALRSPWLGAPRMPPALRGMAWDSTVAATLDSARSERATALRYLTLYGRAIREPPQEYSVPSRWTAYGYLPAGAVLPE